MKKTLLSLAVATSMFAGAVSAETFYLKSPFNEGSDGADNLTAVSYQMGIDFLATSIYTDSDGSYDGSIASTFVTLFDSVNDIGEGSVTSLLDVNGDAWTGNNNLEGYSSKWKLTFEYDILGTVVAVDPSGLPTAQGIGAIYGDGIVDGDNLIKVYYNEIDVNTGDIDPLSTKLVLNLEVLSSSGTIGNAVFNTAVDFTGVDILAQDMFFFENGDNWFDLWTDGQPLPGIEVAARIDSNIDPQFVPTVQPNGTASRTNTLNGSVEFNRVPEPSSIALLGLGLAGLGLSLRRRKTA